MGVEKREGEWLASLALVLLILSFFWERVKGGWVQYRWIVITQNVLVLVSVSLKSNSRS